ncbi:MAG TPA: signal peptidase II [Phycisphaerae bacterium]|nr:signal peptidase II [Phycisphaerae bacterium]
MFAVSRTLATRKAYASARAIAFFLTVTAGGLAADLLTKHYVFHSLLTDPQAAQRLQHARTANQHADIRDLLSVCSRDVCPGVRFTLSTNPGIVFGLRVHRLAVNIATVGAMVLVLAMFGSSDRRSAFTHLAMAFIMGGAMGNLYDRLLAEVRLPLAGVEPIRHQVRDFIDLGQLHYPYIFNVADALLVIGVAILVLHWVLPPRRAATQSSRGNAGNRAAD